MKRFVMAIGLAFALSISAMAGDIHTGDFVPPPPPPGTAQTINATSPTRGLALSVLVTVFSLLAR